MNKFLIILLIWNVVVMFIYGVDKIQAKRKKSRISERALLLCSFLLGGCGAIFGMVVFNHKTSKMKFRILVPITAIFAIVAIYLFLRNI